jgi:uncharacterized protein involved in exopolysaccharide biosynthesis
MALETQRRPNLGRNTNGSNANGPGNGGNGGNSGNSGNGNGGYSAGGWSASGNEQLRDILHVIFKRKQLIGLLFLAVALPGLITTVLQKKRYVASAKVMISSSRTDPTVQPTDVTKLEPVQLNESLVNSEVHVVSSRNLLESVVRSLAASADGGGPPQSGSKPFGQQVLALSQSLGVTPVKASNVIQIDYRHSDPMYAARVVNRVVDEYLAYHAEVHGNKGLSRFYDEQRRSLEQELRRAEQNLIAFTDSEGVVSPKDEISATVHMVGEVSSALREISATISGAEERARVLREQIGQQPEVVKRSQYLEVNPVVTQLTSQLVDRQVDRLTLMRKYTEKDRHIRDNEEEISELRARLDSELRDRPTIVAHQLYRTNPLREDRLRMLLEIESQMSEMRARQATLEDELSRSTRRLVTLRQKSVEYDRLEAEVRNRRETYSLYVKREQEARISQAMDEQKLVNVDVVQRPALPLPEADTRRVSLMLSIIAGLVVGIAGAFAREYMSRSMRSEGDVMRHLGLPLLASIGEAPKA